MKISVPHFSAYLSVFTAATIVFGGLSLTVASAQAETAAAPASGWFTADQIARGEELYETRCATCHAEEIAEANGLWDGTAQELIDMIKSMGMPADNPGGLPPQQYIDIASYIMQYGGDFPLGEEVLAGSEAVNLARR